jgi:hypothetical protein
MVDQGRDQPLLQEYMMSELAAPIYGICGLKGSGKDTFGKLLQEARSDFRITHFADPLKTMAMSVFGLSHEQVYDEKLKEALLEKEIYLDDYIEQMRLATGLDNIQPAGWVAKTARAILQLFGTEYVRKARDKYWIETAQEDIRVAKSKKEPLGIPDTRFINEADAIRAEGGEIIRVLRIDAPPAGDLHQSEVEMSQIVPDIVVGSITGDLSLPRRIARLLAQQDPYAKFFDYRVVEKVLNRLDSGDDIDDIVRELYRGEILGYTALIHIILYYRPIKVIQEK